MNNESITVLSIGGSLVVPAQGIDVDFLHNLNAFIRYNVAHNRRFLLVIGGGKTTRFYQDAAKAVSGNITPDDVDWIGIHATRLNAHLVRTIFKDIAHPRIIENYDHKLENWQEAVVVGAGWKPGWSTDYCAVTLAKDYKAKTIINMTNVYYIYDKDPNIYSDARKFESIKWPQLQKIVGHTWIPGSNVPFDPIATKLASDLGLQVIITHGENFKNIQQILDGKKFKGTLIS